MWFGFPVGLGDVHSAHTGHLFVYIITLLHYYYKSICSCGGDRHGGGGAVFLGTIYYIQISVWQEINGKRTTTKNAREPHCEFIKATEKQSHTNTTSEDFIAEGGTGSSKYKSYNLDACGIKCLGACASQMSLSTSLVCLCVFICKSFSSAWFCAWHARTHASTRTLSLPFRMSPRWSMRWWWKCHLVLIHLSSLIQPHEFLPLVFNHFCSFTTRPFECSDS